jgi:adenosylcobinamide amidohydrolase
MRTEIREFDGWAVGIAYFDRKMECISSAVLNGGVTETSALFIMQVPKDYMTYDPESDARKVRDGLGLPEDSVGMMTAAEVDYVFNSAAGERSGVVVEAVATAGLSNHVLAGEVLDNWEYRHALSLERGKRMMGGTINIAVVSPVPLTMEGKVNLFIPLVEGKSAAMRDAGYFETGTTSDSMAVICPPGDDRATYTGTGSNIGIASARAVRAAVGYALKKRLEHPIAESPMMIFGRLGTADRLRAAARDGGIPDADVEGFLDSYLSTPERVAAVDLVQFVQHRVASMNDDGNPVPLRLINSIVEPVFHGVLHGRKDMMDELMDIICDDIRMEGPSQGKAHRESA